MVRKHRLPCSSDFVSLHVLFNLVIAMQIRTRQIFKAAPDVLWPLLFHSKMDDKQPCYLLCGLPKPLECRLKDSEGGVGKTRECISDKGTIQQTILEWEEGRQLSFELKETDIYFGP